MPVLSIQTNAALDNPDALTEKASRVVADMLGKPEGYVMISVRHNPHMRFAGSTEPLAYLELKSIGLPENRCADFSAALCELVGQELGIDPGRIYIEFSNAERHLFGWNGGTF